MKNFIIKSGLLFYHVPQSTMRNHNDAVSYKRDTLPY